MPHMPQTQDSPQPRAFALARTSETVTGGSLSGCFSALVCLATTVVAFTFAFAHLVACEAALEGDTCDFVPREPASLAARFFIAAMLGERAA